MKLKALTAGLTLAFGSVGLMASVIDFEDLPAGLIPGGAITITVDNVPVTFSAPGLSVDVGNPDEGNHILHSGSYYDPITVTIGGGFTLSSATIRNVFPDNSPIETDIIRGDAYSASNDLVATVTSSNAIHRLMGTGIVKVIYDDVAGTGFAIDDFAFEPVADPRLRMTIEVSCVDVCWTTKTNRMYQAQYRSLLTTNLWTDLGLPRPGTGFSDCITDSVRGQPQKFFRVVELP